MGQRRVDVPVLVVVQDEVAVRERAPLRVLAGQADGRAGDDEAPEGEALGLRPVDPAGLAEGFPAPLELLHELRMDGEALGHREELLVQLAEDRGIRGRLDRDVGAAAEPLLLLLLRRGPGLDRGLQLLVGLAHGRLHGFVELGRLLLGDDALLDESRGVLLAQARMGLDRLVHERLRVTGLVALVVAEAPVADEVDDEVLAEALAVGHRQPDGEDRGLGVVGVHVDDRDVEALREVARVAGRACFLRIGGEPDLVVGDEVEGAAGRVAGQVLQVERLGDHALARESGVAVDQDGERALRVVVDLGNLVVGLDRAGLALDDRVDVLEVARIRREPHRHLARLGVADALGAEVVFHVAGAAFGIRPDRLELPFALELANDHVVGPADGVREDVQPAAVRHADDDLVGAVIRGELDRLVEHRDHRV